MCAVGTIREATMMLRRPIAVMTTLLRFADATIGPAPAHHKLKGAQAQGHKLRGH
jgi:hypothetical protein